MGAAGPSTPPPAGLPPAREPAAHRALAYLPLGLGLLALLGLWWGLGAAARARAERRFAEQVRAATDRLGEYVTVRIANAEAIASLRQAGMLGDAGRFGRHAAIVQRRLGGYFAINWIDPDGIIRWVSPLDPNRRAIGHSVFEHPQAAPMARLAARSRRPRPPPPSAPCTTRRAEHATAPQRQPPRAMVARLAGCR